MISARDWPAVDVDVEVDDDVAEIDNLGQARQTGSGRFACIIGADLSNRKTKVILRCTYKSKIYLQNNKMAEYK